MGHNIEPFRSLSELPREHFRRCGTVCETPFQDMCQSIKAKRLEAPTQESYLSLNGVEMGKWIHALGNWVEQSSNRKWVQVQQLRVRWVQLRKNEMLEGNSECSL
jgi:hypothetical protein